MPLPCVPWAQGSSTPRLIHCVLTLLPTEGHHVAAASPSQSAILDGPGRAWLKLWRDAITACSDLKDTEKWLRCEVGKLALSLRFYKARNGTSRGFCRQYPRGAGRGLGLESPVHYLPMRRAWATESSMQSCRGRSQAVEFIHLTIAVGRAVLATWDAVPVWVDLLQGAEHPNPI